MPLLRALLFLWPAALLSAAPARQAITVTATDYSFSPRELRVTAGRPLSLTVVNNGKETHGLRITLSYGEVPLPMNVPPGEKVTTVIDTLGEPGTYRIYCPVDDHEHKGMTGTIVVARGARR